MSLDERLRVALSQQRSLREVRMFGSIAFMVDGRMAVASTKDGNLLVHVDPARSDELLARPGARQAEMGKGRTMGPAWIEVASERLDDKELSHWLQAALSQECSR